MFHAHYLNHTNQLFIKMNQLNNMINVQHLNGENLASMLSVVQIITGDANGHYELSRVTLAVS